MKRVLVTGGAGFIGSHLCERLLAQGHEVICVDNFYTGTCQNIVPLLNHPNFEVIRHDVCFPLYIEVDQIFNLACPASLIHYQNDPVQTVKTSVHGAINMLGLAKRLRIRIFQASTSEAYGNPSVHPQPESYWGNVNPIGPRMHPNDGRVVSNLIVQALRGEPITLYGDGSQTRSFCYVDDLVRGIDLFMKKEDEFAGPINLGNPVEVTIRQLAECIIQLTGSRSEIVFKPLPADDPERRKPNITVARDRLGWEPITDLTRGLTQTIDYFSHRLAREPAAAGNAR